MHKRNPELVVLSDLHLGTFGCHAAEIANYLRSIAPQTLVLNGDIIDGWQFSKHYFPASHLEVIREILGLLSRGTRVIYITGNHDEVLRRYSDLNIGNLFLTDKLVIELDGKKAWFFHGDVFDASTKGPAKILAKLGGKGYDLLILLNRFFNYLLNLLGREKMSFSKRVKNSVKKAVAWIADFEQTAAELAIEKGYDFVACGHIHQPSKRIVETSKGRVVYLNSGDWVEHLTALEYSGGNWSIYQYNAHEFPATAKSRHSSKVPMADVATQEVSLFINSLIPQA